MSARKSFNTAMIIKKYHGTRTERLIEAIALDRIRDWETLWKMLNFSETELNFHLHVLYDERVLIREGYEYLLVPDFVEAYKSHDWKKVKSEKKAKQHVRPSASPVERGLPIINTKSSGERKKRLRGE